MNRIKNLTWKGSREKPLIIDALWKEDTQNMPVIIWAHGYKGFKDWGAWPLLGEYLAEKGALFISFNFSFNGGTLEEPIDFPDLEAFGNNNYSTEVADFKRIIDFVYASNVLPRKSMNLQDLTIIGHSRGGGMAVLTAHQDERVTKLVTLASISDLERRQPKGEDLDNWKKAGVRYDKNGRTKQEMPHFIQMHEDYKANKSDLDILKAAAELTMPMLIVHGTDDPAVPFSEAEELKSLNLDAELFPVEGADHVFGAKHPLTKAKMPSDLQKVAERIGGFLGL